jgi:ribosomal-protein-alanine N-acetyltransferase
VTFEDVFRELPTLETERLWLRKLRPDDLDDIFEYASDPEVAKYTTWETHKTPADAHTFLASVLERYQTGQIAVWGLEHKSDQKLIGTCALHDVVPHHARAELGYALSRSYWNKGYMTEAVHAVIDFGFGTLQFNRIEAHCLPENIGSARVMEKVGMTFEGTLRQHMFVKGKYDDLRMYSILRSEWRNKIS